MVNILSIFALSCLMCVILEITIASGCVEFCNTIIHGELNDQGKPLHMHRTSANETHPVIISCWAKRLDSSPSAHYNPVLRLLITKREEFKSFRSMPVNVECLYSISFSYIQVDSSNTDYDLGFEYTLYMFDNSMDYTVATCGITYHSDATNNTECWSPTFTFIRYDSSMEDCPTPETTSAPPTTAATTTVNTTSTDEEMLTTASTDNSTTVTEGCNQTSNETETPSTTVSVAAQTSPNVAADLITGFSTGTFISVLIIVILVLTVGIMWIKLRTVSADMKVLQANYDQSLTRENKGAVSNSEMKYNDNSSQNPN